MLPMQNYDRLVSPNISFIQIFFIFHLRFISVVVRILTYTLSFMAILNQLCAQNHTSISPAPSQGLFGGLQVGFLTYVLLIFVSMIIVCLFLFQIMMPIIVYERGEL